MKTRLHVFGMIVAAAGMMFLSACGGDNDNENGTSPTAEPTATKPAATATKPAATNTVAVPTNTVPVPTNTVTGPTNTPSNATPTNTVPVATPTTVPTGGADVCGDGHVTGDEQCDDGNTFGGDGCAANCTTEVARLCTFSDASVSNVQTAGFAIPLTLTGNQTLTTGSPRNSDPKKIVPVVIKASDVKFDPIIVPGLVCACVRGVEKAAYGPGVSAQGQTGCAAGALTDIDYHVTVDHNTNNVDPSCANGTVEDGSAAHPHAGVCNGKPVIVNSGGPGPVGATQITSNSAISLIADGGTCATDGSCDPSLCGDDGNACTSDDPGQSAPGTTVTTSGTAGADIVDVNNKSGKGLNKSTKCGTSFCTVEATGAVPNCDTGSVSGSATASAFVQLDAAQIGDDVVTSTFSCQ